MFKKGVYTPGQGRPKGSKSKVNSTIREVFNEAFTILGGAQRLAQWADKSDENLLEFYKLYAKLIPFEINIPNSTAININIPKEGEDLV